MGLNPPLGFPGGGFLFVLAMTWHRSNNAVTPRYPMDDLPIPRRRKAGRLKQLNKRNRRMRGYLPESELLILSQRIEAMNR